MSRFIVLTFALTSIEHIVLILLILGLDGERPSVMERLSSSRIPVLSTYALVILVPFITTATYALFLQAISNRKEQESEESSHNRKNMTVMISLVSFATCWIAPFLIDISLWRQLVVADDQRAQMFPYWLLMMFGPFGIIAGIVLALLSWAFAPDN